MRATGNGVGADGVAKRHREPNDAERFLAHLVARHGEVLDQLFADGLREWRGIAIPSRRIPSQASLAVLVLAGRENLPRSQVVRETRVVKGKKSRLTKAAENVVERYIRPALNGDAPFRAKWLADLAKGLGADDEVSEDLLSFVDLHSSGPVTESGLTRALNLQEHMEISSLDHLLSDYINRSVEKLQRLPYYYPNHLRVQDLARVLKVGLHDRNYFGNAAQADGLYLQHQPKFEQVFPALDEVAAHSRAALLGDPGHGKTTALAGLLLDHVTTKGRLGLFARLDDLGRIAAAHSMVLSHDAISVVILAAQAHSATFCSNEVRAYLEQQMVTDSNFILVLDGLDEVSTPERRSAVEWVLDALSSSIAGHIVISSRYTGYVRPGSISVQLGLSTLEDVSSFIDHWFGTDDGAAKRRALKAIESNSLAELARIPLIAGFICFVAESEAVGTTKFQLYTQYVALFLARQWRTPRLWRSGEQILKRERAAMGLAWTMATRPNRSYAEVPLPVWADTISLRELEREGNVSSGVVGLIHNDGLLVPHGSPASPDPSTQAYRWVHRTIHEHLTGRALARLVKKDPVGGLAFIRSALLRPTWAVSLEHGADEMNENNTLSFVLEDAIKFFGEGDTPDNLLLKAVGVLATHDETQHRRSKVVSLLIREGCWKEALQLDDQSVRDFIGTELDSISHADLEQLSELLASPLSWEKHELDERWIDTLRQMTERGFAVEAYLQILARSNRAEAERLALRFTATQPVGGFDTTRILRGASSSAVRSLVEAARAVDGNYSLQLQIMRAAQNCEHPELERIIFETFVEDPLNEAMKYLAKTNSPKPSEGIANPSPKSISASLLHAEMPPTIAFLAALQSSGEAPEPLNSLAPWARAGAWSRAPERADSLDVPPEWTREQAVKAVESLYAGRDSNDITAADVERFFVSVRWALAHPSLTPSKLLVDAVYLCGGVLSPKYWWMTGAEWIPKSVGRLPTKVLCESIVEFIKNHGTSHSGLFSIVDEAFGEQSANDADQMLTSILEAIGDLQAGNSGLPLPNASPSHDGKQVITWAERLLAFSEGQSGGKARDDAITIASAWLWAQEALPAYWIRCVTASRQLSSGK